MSSAVTPVPNWRRERVMFRFSTNFNFVQPTLLRQVNEHLHCKMAAASQVYRPGGMKPKRRHL
jgi:hypothetical protein